ncbi:MmgE/PrpD family protein, partial [Mesorhizobium sp. M0195]
FGHPEKPASLADGVQKLKACAEMSMLPFSEKQLGLIGDFINHLDKQPTLAPLFELLVGGR